MNTRLKILGVFIICIWFSLVCRLFYIQVYQGNKFENLGKSQHFREEILPAVRGDILDRYGQTLSTDLAYYEFSAEPPRIRDTWKVATIFSQHLGKPRSTFLRLLKQKRKFVYLDRKVSAEKADKILQRNLQGVHYTAEFKRFYPNGDITGPVIGFTDVDNVGIEGLEYRFNSILSGIPGKRIVTTDALGNHNTDFNYPVQKQVNGKSIVTTLDLDCQTIAVEELRKALKQHNAVSGTVILMDPNTAEILAMVSLPAFDSNNPGAVQAELRKNRSINDTFEPGSIFKLVTVAAALELGVVEPEDEIFCENGQITIGNRIFRDAKPKGVLTVREVIEYSSNIGTYKIATKVGASNLYDYVRRFGFGEKTGIELGGESPGILRKPDKWSSHSLASIGIGHEITVNALQIVNAYASVANGGILMKPYIVKAITDPTGAVLQEFGPQKIRRVMSKQTADTLIEFFEGVVDHGTGKSAKIRGGTVAGKTGTAQKVDPVTMTYSSSDFIASFVALYPSKNTKIVGIVVIDTPKGAYYGGTVAAPVLKNILTRIEHVPRNTLFASYAQLPEKHHNKQNIWYRIKSLWNGAPKQTLQLENGTNGNSHAFIGNGNSADSYDKDTMLIDVGQRATESPPKVKKSDNKSAEVKMPDVRGLSIREAVNILSDNGLDFEIAGSGLVTDQTPLPGKKVLRGTIAYILGKRIDEPAEKR